MYFISRGLLGLAVILGTYSAAIVVLLGWPSSGVLLVGLGLASVRRRVKRWTTLGSARWAEVEDFRRAHMLDGQAGLILGRIFVPQSRTDALWALLSRRISAYEACERAWHVFRKYRIHIVRLPQAIHVCAFGPSGSGKGVSLVSPFLFTCAESCVVLDMKGELASLTAEFRRQQFGHKVVSLDLFKLVSDAPDTFNPLDAVRAGDHTAIDDCKEIAKSLVNRPPEEKEPHWSDSAEAWITAFLCLIVHYGGPEGTRSLQTLRELLSSPDRIAMSIKAMKESNVGNGMLARMAGQLEFAVERERASVMSTVSRYLGFLDSLAVDASTRTSSFDPEELCQGKMTIYLIVPPDRMGPLAGLLRTWISSFLRAVVRRGLNQRQLVHFVIDEAAALGHLDVIEHALDKYRAYGVRMYLYYQSVGQLKKCFPNGQDQTVLANTTQIYFAVNDTATAELVSTRLGEQTIVVESGGTSFGSTSQNSTGAQPQTSRGYSDTTSTNWQQQARKLLKPEEVITLDPRIAITFTPGIPPINTELIRHYEERNWGGRTSTGERIWKAVRVLILAMLCLALSSVVAIAMTSALSRAVVHGSLSTR